jgi:hypothetical protein
MKNFKENRTLTQQVTDSAGILHGYTQECLVQMRVVDDHFALGSFDGPVGNKGVLVTITQIARFAGPGGPTKVNHCKVESVCWYAKHNVCFFASVIVVVGVGVTGVGRIKIANLDFQIFFGRSLEHDIVGLQVIMTKIMILLQRPQHAQYDFCKMIVQLSIGQQGHQLRKCASILFHDNDMIVARLVFLIYCNLLVLYGWLASNVETRYQTIIVNQIPKNTFLPRIADRIVIVNGRLADCTLCFVNIVGNVNEFDDNIFSYTRLFDRIKESIQRLVTRTVATCRRSQLYIARKPLDWKLDAVVRHSNLWPLFG